MSDFRGPVSVVLAADDNFAMQLAVTVRSMLECAYASTSYRIFVIDGGIAANNRRAIEKSLPEGAWSLDWLAVEQNPFSGAPIQAHLTTAAYLRLLMPILLPADVEKVIYLDCDLLVRSDLGALWDTQMGGSIAMAVLEVGTPFMCSSEAMENYEDRKQVLREVGLANYQELGIPADAKYFNSGVLLADLKRWREEQVLEHCLDYVRVHANAIRWCDQDVLNAVLAGKWSALHSSWNQLTQIYSFASADQSVLPKAEFAETLESPRIVHFNQDTKPWHWNYEHPFLEEFLEVLDRTSWSGWRPSRPAVPWLLVRVLRRVRDVVQRLGYRR